MDREPEPVADGSWRVERRVRFDRERRVVGGVPQFGFRTGGRMFAVEHAAGWIGLIEHGSVTWTAGAVDPGLAEVHVQAPFDKPRFAAATAPNTVLVSDARHVHRVDLPSVRVTPVVDTAELAVMELGNCVPGPDGHLWVNDIVGHQVLELTDDGELVRRLGNGSAGFHRGTVGFEDARFGWIYDLRSGPDGRLYVLDSTNYAVRVIDPTRQTVTTICGDGHPGARGDGGSAANGRITTIADASCPSPAAEGVITRGPTAGDTRAARPLFATICGLDLDPATDRLLVPDWVDDEVDELIVLARTTR